MSELPTLRPEPPARVEPRWVVCLVFALTVIGLPLLTTVIAVDRFPELSTLDEPAHIDYLRRVEQGDLPRIGDKLLPETARDVACRTIASRQVSDCALAEIPIEEMDAQGFSYQAQQPPIYYAVTAALRQPISVVVNGFVNSARLTGAAWVSAGLALLWWYLRRQLGASAVATGIACATVGLAPLLISQSATVNNDAAAVLIGAAALVGYDRLRRNPSAATVGFVTLGAVAVVLTKPLAILPVGAASLALLLELVARRPGWRHGVLLMLPAVAALVTYQGWELVREVRATVPYSQVTEAVLAGRETVDSFPVRTIAESMTELLTAYGDRRGAHQLDLYVGGIAAAVGLLFVFGPSIATALGRGAEGLRQLHVGIVTVALAAPPLLISLSYVTVSRDGGSNPRYALALIPMMVTAIVPWMDEDRWVRRAAAVGMFTLLAATLASLITHDLPT